MQLFIAEKPDLARSIMSAFDGKEIQRQGFYIKNDTYFSYVYGHLLEIISPKEFNEKYKNWDISNLPLEIDKFKYKVKKGKESQLNVIKTLLNDPKVSEIIHAGDADDEGQILIDEILEFYNNKKPVKRILLHDLTPEGVKKALASMKDNKEFFYISQAGFARSRADYLVGMNLTMAYTNKAKSKDVINIGRVQTPILALVVNRDLENQNFKKNYYYEIIGDFNSNDLNFKAKLRTEDKILDENEANSLKQKLLNQCYILEVNNKDNFINPPLSYNLLDLQVECSRVFNYKPDYTLKLTQNLREIYKCISYNRSDCKYLPNSIFEQREALLSTIKENLKLDELVDNANINIKSIAFNDEEVNKSSHYGIIPTIIKADKSKMTKDELRVYELISKRFLAQFYPPKKVLQTTITIKNEELGVKFIAKSNKTLELGWECIYKDIGLFEEKKDDEEINDLDLSKLPNSFVSPLNISINKKETKPRPLYTMATLLKDLTSISKYVTDEKIKNLLKLKDKDKKGESGGIGTPATRASIIEKLFTGNYIEEKNKKIISTDLGKELITNLPDILKTPNLTALWWEKQEEIRDRKLSLEDFIKGVNSDIKILIDDLKEKDFNLKCIEQNKTQEFSDYSCKICGNKLVKRQNKKDKSYFYSCSGYPNCNGSYPILNDGSPDYDKQSIKAKEEITSFKCQECNKPLVLITSKNATFFSCKNCKKTYSLNNDKTPKFIDKSHKCPKCDGYLTRRKNSKDGSYFWGCSNYRVGCKVIVDDNNGEPQQYEK